ncbi:hypothetical protein EV424DRAFT_1511830 [Suillus variegatus]|nr:hypothetical protein EV424DRAFT_1511830 [Suillus variegatus]
MCLWVSERSHYLDELIRFEGRGRVHHVCHACGDSDAPYRCEDCFSVNLFCCSCIITLHHNVPLHRVKRWQDRYFHSTTLKQLGLRIQLGDHTEQLCRNPKPARDNDFVIIDVHGIHEVALDFCDCANASSHYRQLLRRRLFPATSTEPRTAATFAVLEHFHLLSFESKVSAYEFYHSLARRSDNTGIVPIKDRYSIFLRIMRQWRNLKSLKRSGRGHDPAGVDATQEGQLAVLCPACPQFGKNVLDDLTDVSPNQRWLHSLFLAIDANFRLKRRFISNDIKDPGLSRGWGYFVEEKKYKAYLHDHGDEAQESACVSHSAVNMADTKASKGLAATGVGSVVCARHDTRLANGVGDLQKGEKYINMDYIVFSALSTFSTAPIVNFSYNIACQWHKKLWQRVSSILPLQLQPNHVQTTFNFFVPKFHIAAHIPACQTNFSFNWTPGVGRTDGEAPERGWADINHVAASTKEMGPGSRRDILDDHFGDWNWKKVATLGMSLKTVLIKEAIKAEKEHQHALAELEESVQQSDLGAALLTTWTSEVVAWELDRSKPNLFESRITAVTQAAVHLKLVMQDTQDLENGSSVSLHSHVTPSILISTGLDLEHAQRRLRADNGNLSQHATNEQHANTLACRNSLQRQIEAWTEIQVLYMPCVSQLRATESSCPQPKPNSARPEDFQLLFPSDICDFATCDLKLLQMEWSLRSAQANDALDECCSHIRLRHQLLWFKSRHLCGQSAHTRAHRTIQAVERRLVLSHDKYSHARSALVCLSRHLDRVGWDRKLQVLKKSDLRPSGKNPKCRSPGDLGGLTQGTAIMSWIWLTHGISSESHDSEGLQDSLRVEWCKTRARHTRWLEEIQLLRVEMHRVLAFFAWEANCWDKRATLRIVDWSEDTEGLTAYAKRQAAIRRALSAHFSEMWSNVGVLVSAGLDDGAEDREDNGPSIDEPPREDLDEVD